MNITINLFDKEKEVEENKGVIRGTISKADTDKLLDYFNKPAPQSGLCTGSVVTIKCDIRKHPVSDTENYLEFRVPRIVISSVLIKIWHDSSDYEGSVILENFSLMPVRAYSDVEELDYEIEDAQEFCEFVDLSTRLEEYYWGSENILSIEVDLSELEEWSDMSE